MSDKTVSIIIPTYNAESYIGSAVESCISQTYKDIEIIVVDDGSTDSTPEIMRKLCSDYRVKYIRQDNTERSAARNRGLSEAVGCFIQFLDSDDMLYPDKIESQVRFLDKNSDYDFVYCRSEFIDCMGVALSNELYDEHDGLITSKILRGNFIPIHAMLSRKNGVRFNPSRRLLEDWEYWVFATHGKKVGLIRDIMCIVRQHKSNSSSDKIAMIKGELSLYKSILCDSRMVKYRRVIIAGIIKRYIVLWRSTYSFLLQKKFYKRSKLIGTKSIVHKDSNI